MTRRSLGFLGDRRPFALFGGLHLEIASGRALDRLAPDDARLQTGTTRCRNGDQSLGQRATASEVSLNSAEGRTITFQHPDLPSTTVALRLWETRRRRKEPSGVEGPGRRQPTSPSGPSPAKASSARSRKSQSSSRPAAA